MMIEKQQIGYRLLETGIFRKCFGKKHVLAHQMALWVPKGLEWDPKGSKSMLSN